MKVLSVVGNRPQFIKSAPTSIALRDAGIEEVVLHTGQHYDREMSEVFFDELALPRPRYRLDLHTSDVEAMQPGIRAALERERPEWALVFGDTNSTLAGARAAVGARIPLAHVEAGLRARVSPSSSRSSGSGCCSARTGPAGSNSTTRS